MSYCKEAKPIITIAAISDIHSNVFALEAVLGRVLNLTYSE